MLILSPEILKSSYDLLNETPPFNKWNLPDSDDVTFLVTKSLDTWGIYWVEGDKHSIGISSNKVSSLDYLFQTMAHEIIHLHMGVTEMDRNSGDHGAAFRKLAKEVCKIHTWDVKAFV